MKQFLFFLLVCSTLSTSAQQGDTNLDVETRPIPEKIKVLWDTSLNLSNRDINSEIALLEAYINDLHIATIEVSKFSDGVYESRSFKCPDNCNELYSYLQASDYNGASNYSELLQKNKPQAEAVLLFTNGITLFEPLDYAIDIPVFIINSKREAAHNYLYELAAATQGSYVNLKKFSPTEALTFLKFYTKESLLHNDKAATDNLYYGVVFGEDKSPIQGATVRIKNSFKEVQTESNGRYKIVAAPGDVLEISAFGMIKKDTILSENKKTHIPLVADGELLDEVLLQQKNKGKESVDAVFGNQKREAVGYSLGQKFTSEDIQPYHTTLAQILVRMPGVIIEGVDGINEKFVFRKTQNASFLNGGKTYPAIILDGLLIDQASQRVPFINPLTIESITLLKSALSTVRFGQLAAYGAIVIKTKDYDYDAPLPENTALVKGNEYNERPPLHMQAKANLPKPDYVVSLERSTTFDEAKSIYFKQLRSKKNNIEFYLKAATYFERWNGNFANAIRSNIAAVAPRNPKALKILAYEFEEKGYYKRAQYINEQLVNLQPKDVQSYRNLALIYVKNKEYELAATLYKQMLYNTIPNVDFTPVEDIVINEFRHLIANHKSQINYEGLPSALLGVGFKKEIRVVLEWNHPAAEYEVQFVSPDKKFFSFSHTAFNNKSLLQSEIDFGYFMKEFIVDDGEKGPWLVNIRYLGDDGDQVPLVLKYTRYKNYGTPQETSAMKVIQLDKFQNKFTLDSFTN